MYWSKEFAYLFKSVVKYRVKVTNIFDAMSNYKAAKKIKCSN